MRALAIILTFTAPALARPMCEDRVDRQKKLKWRAKRSLKACRVDLRVLRRELVACEAALQSCEEPLDPCLQPVEPGPCRAAIRRWYHNADTERCEPFIYGGCQGNENGFATRAACEGTCGEPEDPCDQPAQPGPCQAHIPRWYHNADTDRCERFIYGGCGGNPNNYDTRAACEGACGEDPDPCAAPIEPGPCRAAIPRWAHDAETGRCVRFIFGGCGGNENNFETLEACEGTCDPRDEGEACDAELDPGPCDGHFPRWGFDPDTGRCERFVFGGCGGNANTFLTLAACERACDDPARACGLPASRGPCQAAIPRWFHNAASGRCERFVYGGCGGNANNFTTLAECQQACDCGGDPCDDHDCADHQECRIYGATGEPYCADTCDIVCGPGQSCRLMRVQCVRAPCPPVAVCVVDPPDDPCELVRCRDHQVCVHEEGMTYCADTCDGFECGRGEVCELVDVVCVREPCPPVARCTPVNRGQ